MTIRTFQYAVQVVTTASSGTTYNRSNTDASVVTDQNNFSINQDFIDIEDPLGLFSQATWTNTPSGASIVEDELGLTEDVAVFGFETVEQDLDLTSEVTYAGPLTQSVSHSILSDEATYSYGVRNFSIEDELDLESIASIALPVSVTDALGLVSEAGWLIIADDLGLTDEALWGYGYDASHTLGLTQLAEVDAVLNQTLTDDPVVEQACTYFVEYRCARSEFQVLHGTGGEEPADERLTYDSTFLGFNRWDDGTQVVLRNPETDDRRRYAYDRVNRSFLDGSADIFADADWVAEQTQIYTVVAVKRADLDTVHTFLLDNLGRQILIKDWKGVSWIVIVTNPGEIYTEDSEGYWTLIFEVVGVQTDGEYLVHQLSLSDTVSRAGSIYTRSVSDGSIVTDRAFRNDWAASDASVVTDEVSRTIVVP